MPRSTSGGSATRAATASAGSTTRRRLAAPARRRGGPRRSRPPGTTPLAALARGAPALPARGDRRPRLAPDVQRGPVRAPAPARPALDLVQRRLRGAAARAGDEDDFLIRADKNPNTRGAELIGLAPGGRAGSTARGILAAAAAREDSSCCGCFHHDLARLVGSPTRASRRPSRTAEMVVFQGTNAQSHERGARTWCCRARPTSSATAPSPTSRVACSASGPRSMRSARRGRTGRSSRARAGAWRWRGRRRSPPSAPTRSSRRSPAAVPAFAGMTLPRASAMAGWSAEVMTELRRRPPRALRPRRLHRCSWC